MIDRGRFRHHEELRVWVQAKTRHGSAKSPEVVLYPAHIIRPPPPIITQNQDDVFDILWSSVCSELGFSVGKCSVQYRTEADQDWHEEEGSYGSYPIEEHQLCTAYDFRVRCACDSGLTSDWSAILTIQDNKKPPEGEIDVWSNCDVSHANTGCFITWKRLPVTCGSILEYEITLVSSNTMNSTKFNVSSANPKKIICDEVQCHYNSSVERSRFVSVSAYNAYGATRPSYLKRLGSGKEENKPTLHIEMNAENLTVSWKQSSLLADNLKGYVVQYKQFGSDLGHSFDWAKLNKSQTTAFFRGQFKNYTAYQVSLFTLSNSNEVRPISSALGYSLQKVPSNVPSFKVSSLGDRHVTLQWEPVPILQQYGLMQYYEIGVAGQNSTYNVYNLSALPQDQYRTFSLGDLSPGQVYDAWIRAVNAAGPGENTTRRFTTKDSERYGFLSVIVILCFLFVVCTVGLPAKRHNVCGSKVPDPNNSQIFREMKLQTSDSMAWICIPFSEPHPTMSLLEIVISKSPQDVTSDTEEQFRDGSLLLDSQDTVMEDSVKEDSIPEECDQKDNRCKTEAYSKIVDSDEETDMNSSDEEQDMSGYERHFMPTAIDMLEVSG